jgi:hypothetical protein
MTKKGREREWLDSHRKRTYLSKKPKQKVRLLLKRMSAPNPHAQNATPRKSGEMPNDTPNFVAKFKDGSAVIADADSPTLKTFLELKTSWYRLKALEQSR